MALVALLILAVILVAIANGANDNFKGVATLFGSGTTHYRRALAWGTVTTLAGSLTAILLAERLIQVFGGSGLVPPALAGSASLLLPVAVGAGLTVLSATLLGMPVSTTHALTGALIGGGWILTQGHLRLNSLGTTLVLPLLCSPLIAILLVLVLYPAFQRLRRRMGITRSSCVCVENKWVPVSGPGQLSLASAGIRLRVCQERYSGTVFACDAQNVLNAAHYLTAGAVSYARGLNDTPKMVAILLGAQALGLRSGTVVIAIAIALGAALGARRVAATMSHRITQMNHGQGFVANLVTAGLVIAATRWGLPVSTTHVSCGSLFGIGLTVGEKRWSTIGSIVGAWILTLPMAGAIAALAALLSR
jgi:PiT family inorganic phosphate transporter